jgi:multiple antibiotic resistance protein
MTQLIGFALLSFSSLLAMIDPLTSLPIYVSSTAHATPAARAATLRRAVLTAFAVLVGFGALGSSIFALFGITTGAFRIAGGIVLFNVGLDMLQAQRSRVRSTEQEEAAGELKEDIGIIPLGIPLIAGPGAITTVIGLLAQAQTTAARAVVYAMVVVVLLITYVVLRLGPLVTRRIGLTGIGVIERVMGLVVTVVGVQFVADGLVELAVNALPKLRTAWG